jgi:hypothetical protein
VTFYRAITGHTSHNTVAERFFAGGTRYPLTRADGRDNCHFVCFLDHRVFSTLLAGQVYIIEVDSDKARIEDLGFDARIFGLELSEELAQWHSGWQGFIVFASKGTGTGKEENVEMPSWWLGYRRHYG